VAGEYIRFLRIVERLKGANSTTLDSIETKLLHSILLSYSEGRIVLVGDLIHLSQIASPATLHGIIKRLAELGYINLIACKEDARRRLVMPAKLADNYLLFMSRCLVKAL